MKKNTKQEYLRRYTNIPSLIDILKNKKITLLDPITWDDRNDSYFIEQYKIKSKLKAVLCLCFTGRGETYHHWKVFSEGPSGICIVFNKKKLLKNIRHSNGFEYETIKYMTLNKLKANNITIPNMPFVKRQPYKDEKEFRIIYKDKKNSIRYKHVDIDLNCIDKVILSPWVPDALIDPLRKTIKSFNKEHRVRVWKSTLISNENWKNIGESITN